MPRDEGFTLIELLVVMAIVALLAGIGLLGIPAMLRSSEAEAVKTVVTQIAAALEAYSSNPKNGDFPPTALSNDAMPGFGVSRNDKNTGIESVMLCLHRPNMTTSFDIEDVPWPDAMDNLDQDRTRVTLTDFGRDNRNLYELLDWWGTPFAYFHHRDYDSAAVKNMGRINGLDGIVKAKPWKSPKGFWYRRNGFQLISAGPDGVFNTGDDITNFER